MTAKIVLKGRPITKKNSQQISINRRTGRRFVRPSKAYTEYEEACLWQLKTYRGPKFTGPVEVKALYYMPNRRSWPDLIGLLQATSDILESAGIIQDDKLIVSYDGSRIVGIDKQNPRAEITITEVAS